MTEEARMIKILFFIDEITGGGAEKVLRTLVNNMDQRKFEITVQTLNAADPKEYLAPGIRYKAINRCKTSFGRKLYSYWLRLCAELKWIYPLYIRDDYDIEVAYLECGPTKMLAGSTNKKALKLAWVHCDMAKKEGMTEQTEKLKQFYRAYDKVVCVAETVCDSFVKLFGSDSEAVVLYNVNDETEILRKADAFLPERDDVPTFCSVGRLSFEKGNDRLIEACRMLKADGCDFRLWIIGDGSERTGLEEQIKASDLESCVKLWGFQSNPYPYMKAADFLVVPSRFEGFSTVVTESLILGKTVITTPCSGMREQLGDSEYGLITEDSAEGLYDGIKKMLVMPQLLERYTFAAGLRGRDFTKKNVLAKTEDCFCRELKKKQG